jgi:hypothetical protein
LNIFNLPVDTDESDIRKFYKDINILKIHRPNRDAADLEFESKELLIKAIDFGTGSLRGQQFFMRSSYYRSRHMRNQGRPSRGGRGGGRGGRYRG